MTESISLGRIGGVRIGANWSVLAILALITFGLAAGRFPALVADLPWVAYAAAGLVTGLVFLLSLLAHEISHAFVAQRNGLRVEGITLWLFGGVAKLEGEAATPGADLRIAGVGPLVSVVLGAGFFGLAALTAAVGGAPLIVAALGSLALINGVLAVFNLVPAAPLDGGRLLRAALWRRSGDRYRSAVTAARAGRVFGLGLIGLGIAQLVLLPGFGAIWLALVGWFLVNAAGAEQRSAAQQQRLDGIHVTDVMSPDPHTAPPELTVSQFVDSYAMQYRFSSFPLVDRTGRFVGLVTLNRIRAVAGYARGRTRLIELACTPDEVPVARPDEALADLLPRMAGCADGRAVVLHGGQVVGIVSPTDIARASQAASLWERGGSPRP